MKQTNHISSFISEFLFIDFFSNAEERLKYTMERTLIEGSALATETDI